MKKILGIILIGIFAMGETAWGIGNALELMQAVNNLNTQEITDIPKEKISEYITKSPSLLNVALLKAIDVSKTDTTTISNIISYFLDIILENKINQCFETKTKTYESYLDVLIAGLKKDTDLFNAIIRNFVSKFKGSSDKTFGLTQLKNMQINIKMMSKKSKQAIKAAISELEKETPEIAQLKTELGQLKGSLSSLQKKLNTLNAKLNALQTKLA